MLPNPEWLLLIIAFQNAYGGPGIEPSGMEAKGAVTGDLDETLWVSSCGDHLPRTDVYDAVLLADDFDAELLALGGVGAGQFNLIHDASLGLVVADGETNQGRAFRVRKVEYQPNG